MSDETGSTTPKAARAGAGSPGPGAARLRVIAIDGPVASGKTTFSKDIFAMDNPIGFIWIIPGSFFISFLVSWLVSLVLPKKPGYSF